PLVVRGTPALRIRILGGGLELDEGARRLAGADQGDVGAADARPVELGRDGQPFRHSRKQRQKALTELLKSWRQCRFADGGVGPKLLTNAQSVALQMFADFPRHASVVAGEAGL